MSENILLPRSGQLCDYPCSSSEEESEEGHCEEGRRGESPRKRKADGSANDGPYPRDAKGALDLLGSQKEWRSLLEAKLRAFTPRSHSDKSLLEVDATNLELKVIHKRRRRCSEEESSVQQQQESTNTNNPEPADRRRKFTFKPFKKTDTGKLLHDESRPEVSVLVPEKLEASYGLYVWPSSHVLSWFIWAHKEDFVGKRVLELGCGTSLPGLLCAKIGAASVVLSDKGSSPDVLSNIRTAIHINELSSVVSVRELTWGLLTHNLTSLEGSLDVILGSDLFFDPKVFRDLVLSIAKLLSLNPSAEFICAVQERSPDWCIAEYLEEFGLRASYVYPKDFLSQTGLDEGDLIGGHTIYIMKLILA